MTAVRPAADDQRAAVVAGFLGWTLDAFDFFLVVMTLTAIAREFGKSDAAIALSITLTLAFRPVGAFIFGLVADRYRRKLPLMLDLVFFLGGLPALLALFVRARVRESAVWRETRHDSWTGLGRAIRANLPLFGYITILMWMMNMVSHGTQDMYPTFLQRHWGFGAQQRGDVTIVSMIGALMGGVAFGLYSDRLGRRPAIGLALGAAVAAVPPWAFAGSVPLLVVGAFVMQFFVQGAWGVIPAHITELSPDSVRGFLPGFAYQCGVALAGSIGWLEARFAEHLDYAWAMALTAATVFVLGAVVAQLGPERRGVAFGRGAP